MQTELDLANNNIINAGSVETDTLLLGGVLMTPSGVDPVYSGTISSFGASLIDDVDAAAGRTTLGLSTVASTGSYTDLSNQPSLNFASSAQGVLADSSVQPTDTQAESAWTTGTSTTESLASPAKIKSAIESLVASPKSFAESYVTYSGTTPTQVDGYGFSSVSRPAVGQTSFVFSTVQPDTDYVVDIKFQGGIGAGDARWSSWVYAKSTTGYTIIFRFVTLVAVDVDLWTTARRLT
tara:strand:+ start:356 stop:1066 length:711 start_codon:yes stop_codon:yes gene_type:complete